MATVRRTAAKPLTERAVQALKAGQKRADGALPPGFGRLIVRAQAREEGVVRQFFFRFLDADGRDRMLLLGVHGTGPGRIDLAEARRLAHERREQQRQGVNPQQQRADERQENRARERAAAQTGTLADLIYAYVADLQAKRKASATDTERTLQLHVVDAFPDLAKAKARDITSEDVSDIMARMIGKGIERRTNIVRAMLSAAFAFGAALDNDPRRKARASKGVEDSAKRFGITTNPVALVKPIAEYERAGERVLTDDELRTYWTALDGISPAVGACLKASLLLGGQRLSQLKRLTRAGYSEDDRTVELVDAKGRGGARLHVLPVSDRVAAILESTKLASPSGYVFSTSAGAKQIDISTLSLAVSAIGSAIADEVRTKHPEANVVPFTARDLRRTVETRMAALGISKEIRAHVLSHGRTAGVQGKHYDRYSYMPEKTAALARWEAHIDQVVKGDAPKVIRGVFRETKEASNG